MTSKLFTALTCFTVAAGSLIALDASPASAKGKDYYVQDYHFKRAMHGFSGSTGNYYCSYQRLPNRVCVPTANGETCKIVGWTLRQSCQ